VIAAAHVYSFTRASTWQVIDTTHLYLGQNMKYCMKHALRRSADTNPFAAAAEHQACSFQTAHDRLQRHYCSIHPRLCA
jgi:hypothetical protein